MAQPATPANGRRERKREETRERIFRAALELFAKHGFAETRVEQITEAADVAKGTFFNYFPAKEHLLMYFGGKQREKVERALDAVRVGSDDIPTVLRRMAHELVAAPARTPELARSLFAGFLSSEEIRKVLREEIAGRGRRTLAELLKIGQQRGEVRTDIPAIELARTYQQAMFGTLLLWSLNPVDPLDRVVDCTVELLWSGLQVAPATTKTTRRQRRKAL